MGDTEDEEDQSMALEEEEKLAEIIKKSMNTLYQMPGEQPLLIPSEAVAKKRRNEEIRLEDNACKQNTHIHTEQHNKDHSSSSYSQSSSNSLPLQVEQTTSNAAEYNSFYLKCKENRYASIDSGPFIIYAETINRVRLHPMRVGKIIRNFNLELYKNITMIKDIGRNRVKIVVNSNYKDANALIDQECWATQNIVCFIPSFSLYKQGVIRDVDTTLTENEIVNYAISDITVTQAKRIYKIRELEDKSKIKVPIPVVIISFRGQYLSRDIKLLGVKCNVDNYKQKVIQCYLCLRYGHTSQVCKNKLRCENCGASEHEKRYCENQIKCIFCNGPHKATDSKNCPEFVRQKAIKDIMAEKNLTFPEAAEVHRRNIPTSYAEKAKKNVKANDMSYSPPPPLSQFPSLREQIPTHNEQYINSIREFHPRSRPERGREPRSYSQKREANIKCTYTQEHISNNLNLPVAPIVNDQAYKNNLKENLVELIMANLTRIITLEYPSLHNENLSPSLQPLVFKAINESLMTIFTNPQNVENSAFLSESESL